MDKVYIVEGRHDTAKLKQVNANIKTIETNGSEISKDTLNLIKVASEKHEIVIVTDPDSPGQKIRHKIAKVVPAASHVFLPKNESISKNKKKVGLEHISVEVLKNLLELEKTPTMKVGKLSVNDLYDLGLIGKVTSTELRNKVGNNLGVGYANGKTFLMRCNLFGYNKVDLLKVIGDLNE